MKITFSHDVWREKRLIELVSKLREKDVINEINELHDHKGTLIVTWYKKPDRDKINIVDNTWDVEFNEYETKHLW